MAIYLNGSFWLNLIKEYNIPDWGNISYCYKLRKLYKKYKALINSLYEKNENINYPKKNEDDIFQNIKNDINSYYERDEFAVILNRLITNFFEIKKDKLTNSEIIGTLVKYNPYFSMEEEDREKYKNSRSTSFLDNINLKKITTSFIGNFRRFNLEKIFEENIGDFIDKIISKINNITTFGNVIKLIDVNRIKEEKQIYYFEKLKRYFQILKNDLILIKDKKELKNAIIIISEFISMIFLFEKNNCFLKEQINKLLEQETKELIYFEILTNYKDDKYKELKNYIYDIYLDEIDIKEGRDNIIKLVKKLNGDARKYFIYEKILEKCQFTKEEFFSNEKNYKIETLCLLNKELNINKNNDEQKEEQKNGKDEINLNILFSAEEGNKNAQFIITQLDIIMRDLEHGIITKKVLEKFLNIKRVEEQQKYEDKKCQNKITSDDESEYTKDKLELIALRILNYDPNVKYIEYKYNIEKINEKIDILKFIKNSLMIFHKNLYNEEIKKITIFLEEIENGPIFKFRMDETRKTIESLEKYRMLCEEIKKVKDFLIFKKIFENVQGRDQAERFDDALRKLKKLKYLSRENHSNIEFIFNERNYVNIFKEIKEELSREPESKSKILIHQMIDYFEIKDKIVIIDLKILINSKKYENIVKSIKYFFDNFSDKKLILPKDINLSEMSLKTLKRTLNELKSINIYDYEIISPYFRVFTSFYEKKEAIDFLKSKINIDTIELSNKLKYKLDPYNRSISIKDIEDTIICLTHFKKFINYSPYEIIGYVKLLEEEQIRAFESFTKKFRSIIELDTKNDKDPFEEVFYIINDASLIFYLTYEDFCYNRSDGKLCNINIDELIKLKNKINIIQTKKTEIKNKINKDYKKDVFEIKFDKLLFFKTIISNLEIIYEKISILRRKGFNIPTEIKISIRYPEVSYELNGKKKEFNEIINYLNSAKVDYEEQLDKAYETKKYLRLLYGKLFQKLNQHLEGNIEIEGILRYILNKTNYNDRIKAGELYKISLGENPEELYKDYTKEIFDNIHEYLITLFRNNNTDFKQHYDKMLIIKEYNGRYWRYKGFEIKKCVNMSIKEYIFSLFMDKLNQLPIAQNILICNKETSIEEIQSFFYRAILCEYNTLFVIEISYSFSDFLFFQMIGYIDKILTMKLQKYKKENKGNNIKNLNKSQSSKYLDSRIVFIYTHLVNESRFLCELRKYLTLRKAEERNEKFILDNESYTDDSNISNFSYDNIEINTINNIKVISSDVCGLGKSFRIKKMIIVERKNYYHFPLGGKLSKKIIYQKLYDLLEKIKKDVKNKSNKCITEEDYSNIAIHLDLMESRNTNLINDFLFSFLITKFYSNDKNIIYIPNNIKIYIEIPNSNENYLDEIGILKIFKIENITLGEFNKNNNIENIPMLPLDLLSDIIQKFRGINGFKNCDEIDEFIRNNFNRLGIKEYSYRNVAIFIKIYVSQFESFIGRLGNNIINELIKNLADQSIFFAFNGFSKLMLEKRKNRGYYDLVLDTYESDLEKMGYNFSLVFIDGNTKTIQTEKFGHINEDKKNISFKYLKKLKKILNLPNDLEKDIENKKSLLNILNSCNDNYVITEDTYKKILVIYSKIKANVPIIIMGETGCGKTLLIKKLSQILNNGEELVRIITLNPTITDEEIINKMKEMNKIAEKPDYTNEKKTKKNELWVFFDDINTCLSQSLLTEIFINRTFNGIKLEDNIRLIGACNPYRKRREFKERCGLTREDDDEYDQLIYKVNQLPQTLLYYVFNFGCLRDKEEKNYIRSIIQKLFDEEDENLHELTTEAISNCHRFLRDSFRYEPSIVSLREVTRFKTCVEFFMDYYLKKDGQSKSSISDDTKKLNKIKSIICSIYICYYIRLTSSEKRAKFEISLQKVLLKIANYYCEKECDNEFNGDLLSKIKYQRLRYDLRCEKSKKFSDLLRIEEDFLLRQIEMEHGIGKNILLKENIFLLFVSLVTKIPLIMVGKPGSSKSLSIQLILNSMRGKYSKSRFFLKYPQIIATYFQGNLDTTPEEVGELFNKVEDLYCSYYKNHIDKNDLEPIHLIIFDKIDLAERSYNNPLSILHKKIEYNNTSKGYVFVGISNYTLDDIKMNQVLNLSVPDLEDKLDQLKSTSKSIVEGISYDIYENNNLIFNILARAYYQYKYFLNFIKKLVVLKQYNNRGEKNLKGKNFREIELDEKFIKLYKRERKIKIDFHGYRDFYNLIKGVAIEASRLYNISDEKQIAPIINHYIERNFGGVTYEIDIDFDLELEDIRETMNELKKHILNEKLLDFKKHKKRKFLNDDNDDNIIKITSVSLFKKIYNLACIKTPKENENPDPKIYQLGFDYLENYDLNKCIYNNINDYNSRYLLLEISSNITPLISQIIRVQNSYKKNIGILIGSPLPDNNNKEYKFEKINEIKYYSNQEDKLIILQNLYQIQPYLYDLYNMNYKIIDDQKFVKIYLDNFSEQLTPVNDSFKIIVLVDKIFINRADAAFLNRLEKVQISFEDLLDRSQKEFIKRINEKIRLKEEIKAERRMFNYDLDYLLINCNEEDIGGLIYSLLLENKKEDINEYNIKDKIFTKISNLIPQDIAIILSENNPIKRKYYERKRYYDFKQYIKDLSSKNKDFHNYKISIIYTFSNITNTIEEFNKGNEFMISEITSKEKLKNKIDEIKAKNELHERDFQILIRFEDYNSNKLQYIANYINNYYKDDEYHYIFIIFLKRNFQTDTKQEIYYIPNIYNNINQLFIDNLEGPDITLKNLLYKNISDVMLSEKVFKNLDKEFKETLIAFVDDKMTEKKNKDDEMLDLSSHLEEEQGEKNNENEDIYCENIINYMLCIDLEFKDKIIEKAKELIKMDKDARDDCNYLVDKMFKEKYFDKNIIDIISCILDYIKENIFIKYLKLIFNILEDNNFLTTLIEINKDKTCRLDKNDTSPSPNNSRIIKELETKFLKEIKVEYDKKYEPKFLSNFKIPGFYKFYKNLSAYLKKEINIEFFQNEKKLRNFDFNHDTNISEIILEFHEKEEELLKKVLEKIYKDKIYSDLVYKITPDLILKDYITFYLQKNLGFYSEPIYDLISLLLKLRFSDEINIIKNNINDPFKIVIIKIIWIESYIEYIKIFIKVFELGKEIFDDDKGNTFYNMIFNSIHHKKSPIKYIANKDRPKYLMEINECFYKILAGLCLSLTTNDMDKMGISIYSYCVILKNIYKILNNINDDLSIYSNELYIIDELIKIIDYHPNIKKNIINEIRYHLTESAIIIQKNRSDKSTYLIQNIKNLNKKMKLIKIEKTKDKYYDILKYIYKSEIKIVNDKVYSSLILEEIIKDKEIIKISNDIFQMVLEPYINTEKFEDLKDTLLCNNNNIIKLLNSKLSDKSADYYLALSEAMIYLFERYSLIYLKDFSDIKKFVEEKEEEGHLMLFKECNEYLQQNASSGNTYITELFCIGYIKSFCYTFIKMHNNNKFNPENIIKIINEIDKMNMIKLYIYKIIYNKNNRQINAFLNNEIINKYKLDNYKGFNEFINKEEIEKLEHFNYENNNKLEIFKKLREYAKKQFKERITKDDISPNKEIEFDDFFKAANNLILSKLTNENFENDISYINFYSNVCEPLYKKGNEDDQGDKLFPLMKFLFKKKTYQKIKKEYSINSEDIEALLYGYRYCLNEVKDKEGDFIYSYLYNKNNLSDFHNKFYPGNDNNKEDSYYELYYKILDHFKKRPKEGCYVCLCDKGYYHSVPSGFPGFLETNMRCEKCHNEIGSKEFYKYETVKQNDETKVINIKVYETVQNNAHYYRIFKDEKEIEHLKRMKEHYKNFEKTKYMTLDQFKEEYIIPIYSKEKGLNKIDINNLKKENKVVRNLSQISFRLLNYILCCHVFFAKLYTTSEKFDNYKPKEISWFSLIKFSFTKLRFELEKNGINNLDIFMNCTFKDLFDKLHNHKSINNFEELIKFEDELEKIIKEKIEKAKEEINNYKILEKENIKDEKSFMAIIKEIYDKSKYNNKEFPFYEHFFYTDYLDEDYIENILKYKDENNYPVLVEYLKNKNQKNDGDKYNLKNLALFHKVLNLFNEKYSNKISREFAEKQKIKNSDIYQEEKNKILIDDFIKLYNNFKLGEELNIENNYLCDFLLIDDKKYGYSYKQIYKEFINKQNIQLENILDKKITSGEFDINCKKKINIQQIKENEIFIIPEKNYFLNLIFNSSYRKYIDTKNVENYNEYILSLEQIESEMTNYLLKNKKLLNDDIINFIFIPEAFSYEITDLIYNFAYGKIPIDIDDKISIFNFIKNNGGNIEKYQRIINDFIIIIKYLNEISKEQNNKINENTKIYDIEIVKNLKNISMDFKEIFGNKNNIFVSKIINIFDYYLKTIFKYVKSNIQNYQEKYGDKKSLYNYDDKDMIIKKENLATAIRLFMTLVLFREREKDKDKKIKFNEHNIVDYLNNENFWESSLFKNQKFKDNLSKIKELNIKIKEILFFYCYLLDNKDEKFENEVVEFLNQENKINKSSLNEPEEHNSHSDSESVKSKKEEISRKSFESDDNEKISNDSNDDDEKQQGRE